MTPPNTFSYYDWFPVGVTRQKFVIFTCCTSVYNGTKKRGSKRQRYAFLPVRLRKRILYAGRQCTTGFSLFYKQELIFPGSSRKKSFRIRTKERKIMQKCLSFTALPFQKFFWYNYGGGGKRSKHKLRILIYILPRGCYNVMFIFSSSSNRPAQSVYTIYMEYLYARRLGTIAKVVHFR